VVLLFTVLLAASAAIVAMAVFNMRKRRRRAEEKERQQLEEKRRKAEEERKHLEEEAQQKIEEEMRRKVDEEQKRLADELEKAEEERKRIEEEKRHRAQEEEKRRKAEKEAQERAEKEELWRLEVERQQREEERSKAEDGHNKAEEACKRADEESQHKKEEARVGKWRPPLKRGGRPRGSTERSKIEKTSEKKPRSLKPEIVCWNEGWNWVIGIEVPGELETQSVAQNEEPLEYDNTVEKRYRLKHAEGRVKITWTGGEKDIPLLRPERNYLVFKMRKDWKGLGRLVIHPTTGHYLAIVPQDWKRDEEVSDSASVNPESVQLDGYKAHFFYQEQDRNTVIGFITANDKRIRVESRSPRFKLVGGEIGDDSEEMGPLFGKQPPGIQTLDKKEWNDIGVIVVGEERSGRNRWRMQFVPQVGAKEQKLPEEIANRRGGWYFVRIYDNHGNLSESMDFRFLAALNNIRIERSDFLPGPNGYNNVTVRFLHQTGCKVELMNEDTQHTLEIRRENDQTIVTIPPKSDCDKTHWILRDGDAEIEVTVLVKRIWWAFGVIGVPPTDWADNPITLYRKDFTAITDNALWVRLPRMRFVRKIEVGFDRNKSRSYQVEVEEKEITIPLRDFCDTQEIENQQKEFEMKIWVQSEGAKPDETVVVKVPAEQPTTIEQKQQQVPKTIPEEEKNSLSQAIVKCQSGKRKGKGFSKKELTEANINIKYVKLLNIPYDKRRKTSHSWNIENLKYITER